MKSASNKGIWIILLTILFFLISCASTQKEKTESRDGDFYIKRGNAYDRKGQYNQAISDYSKALEINPRLAEA
ncbi:MAG: tetratricopeptide repeat protein, partial [Thermodesulfobacteriota bacterium]